MPSHTEKDIAPFEPIDEKTIVLIFKYWYNFKNPPQAKHLTMIEINEEQYELHLGEHGGCGNNSRLEIHYCTLAILGMTDRALSCNKTTE